MELHGQSHSHYGRERWARELRHESFLEAGARVVGVSRSIAERISRTRNSPRCRRAIDGDERAKAGGRRGRRSSDASTAWST